MALVESYMLPLGTKSPKFSLLNVLNNQNETLDELKGKKGYWMPKLFDISSWNVAIPI